MSQFIYVSLQGSVYFTGRRTEDHDAILQMFHRKLVNTAQEFSFEALYKGISYDWHRQDDIPNPFGDRRECLVSAVWIIDLDNDVLQLCTKDQNRRISLRNLRQGPVSIADLEPYDPPALPKYNLDLYFPRPPLNVERNASERQTAFVSRILEDFSHQWRHVLRSRYNDSTFRTLARAIVRIATLDFKVVEVASSHPGIPGPLVQLKDIPQWEPFPGYVVHSGRVSIILCQHLAHALSAISEDFGPRTARYRSKPNAAASDANVTYLVLSIREVFLCRINLNDTHAPVYTKPEILANGVDPPSKRAVEYLLMATPSNALTTPIHKLPLEVQDLVLRGVSKGSIEAARVGCLLDLGSNIAWNTNGHVVKRQEVFTVRASNTPVGSQIWFDNCFSGLAYK